MHWMSKHTSFLLLQDTGTDHMLVQLMQKFCNEGSFLRVEDCAEILAASGNDYDEAVRRLMAVKGQVRSPSPLVEKYRCVRMDGCECVCMCVCVRERERGGEI
jgi:hypothetical protein